MNAGKIIAWGVGGVILYSLFSKARALATLTFFPGGISSIIMDGLTPVLTATILVQNTSNQKIVLQSIAGNLYLNDGGKSTLIGNASQFTAQEMPANSETVVTINVRLFLIGAVNDIVKSFQYGGGAPRKLELDGMANVDAYQLPLKLSFQIGK